MPSAANWRIPSCDLVLSLSHCVAKAAQAPRNVPHACYCFTPMRYAWHMRDAYFNGRFGRLKSALVDSLLSRIREWDRRTAARVTHFIGISKTVRNRIAECYGRDSIVIYPPVDTDYYSPADCRREAYYLVVSACAPYKRIDLAIEACRRLNRSLIIIGSGQDAPRLRASAGPNVQFLGWQPDSVIRDHLRRCRALIFPGEEDFGIVPVEANACGAPVIAYGRGGATETILPLRRSTWPTGPTGVWFEEQSVESLAEAIEEFECSSGSFETAAMRRQALKFNRHRFEAELFGHLDEIMRPTQSGTTRRAA
jgi:glycosyltransferase involved in cell wall biosynthesis